MLHFSNTVKQQEIINRCVEYLPNPNEYKRSVYKVDFIIKPTSAFLPDYANAVLSANVHQAFFKIEYNESGGRMWVLDKLDSDAKSELIYNSYAY